MVLLYPDFFESNAKYLASKLGIKAVKIYTRTFPNNEVLIRLDRIDLIKSSDNIMIFFPTYPDTNNRIVELLETLDTVKYYNSAAYKTLILPYLSYSRQDKRFLEGEALSLETYLKLLCYLGMDRLIVFDVHSLESFKKYICCDYIHITLYNHLFDKIRDIHKVRDKNDLIIVAPDIGRLETVKQLSKKYGYDYMYLEKRRDRYTGTIQMKLTSDIQLSKYKFVLLIDDEISTGGTMSLAAKSLRKHGAENIIAAAIHLLLVSNADLKLLRSGVNYIYGSNTIENPYSIINIEDIIAEIPGIGRVK